jgi:hypothetical protein
LVLLSLPLRYQKVVGDIGCDSLARTATLKLSTLFKNPRKSDPSIIWMDDDTVFT